MGEYTNTLENIAIDTDLSESLDPRKDAELLIDIASKFRTFDKAITAFVVDHGYEGDVEDESQIIEFISQKFCDAKIKIPRSIKRWFTEKTGIEKYPTGYQFCFAFNLDIKESNDFFNRVCLSSGIDCHNQKEVVLYYCLKNKIPYENAEETIDWVSENCSVIDGDEVKYTSAIKMEIDRISSIEDLKEYLLNNRVSFYRNKITAMEYVRRIWDEIKGKEGLANIERKEFYFDEQEREKGLGIKNAVLKERSIPELYNQILGLDSPENLKHDKSGSIKTILKNNPMLCEVAEKDFPDLNGLKLINTGKTSKISHVKLRRILILLAFYRFWVKLAIDRKNYEAIDHDADRFLEHINQLLDESGYPELYYGNPFDWIFLYSINMYLPLSAFRDYISTLRLGVFEE